MWFRGGSGSPPLANCFLSREIFEIRVQRILPKTAVLLYGLTNGQWIAPSGVMFHSLHVLEEVSPHHGVWSSECFPSFFAILMCSIAVLIYRMLKYLGNHTWNFINNTYILCLSLFADDVPIEDIIFELYLDFDICSSIVDSFWL